MGTPAARLGDPTVHGGVIVEGCPQVMIGGQPAARMGDMHTCPVVTILVPHAGGPLVMGSLTVMTGGMAQSRVGDALTCVGPPDAVAMGCPTVMVGMSGGGGAGLGGLLMGLALGPLQTLYAAKAVLEFASKAADAVEETANTVGDAVFDFESKAVEAVEDTASKAAKAAEDRASKVAKAAEDFRSKAAKAVEDRASKVAKDVEDARSKAAKAVEEIAKKDVLPE